MPEAPQVEQRGSPEPFRDGNVDERQIAEQKKSAARSSAADHNPLCRYGTVALRNALSTGTGHPIF